MYSAKFCLLFFLILILLLIIISIIIMILESHAYSKRQMFRFKLRISDQNRKKADKNGLEQF